MCTLTIRCILNLLHSIKRSLPVLDIQALLSLMDSYLVQPSHHEDTVKMIKTIIHHLVTHLGHEIY